MPGVECPECLRLLGLVTLQEQTLEQREASAAELVQHLATHPKPIEPDPEPVGCKHEPDWPSAKYGDAYIDPDNSQTAVDINCRGCGISGSIAVAACDIDW